MEFPDEKARIGRMRVVIPQSAENRRSVKAEFKHEVQIAFADPAETGEQEMVIFFENRFDVSLMKPRLRFGQTFSHFIR